LFPKVDDNHKTHIPVESAMAIFVIGMHRSGTSMVASILQSLGISLGPETELMPGNQFNEAGYFENIPGVEINEDFLRKNDLTWRTLPTIELKKSLSGHKEYLAAIGDMSAKLEGSGPWAFKDPRLSFLLPHWKAVARPVSAIVCLRRPDAVALSLSSRSDMSLGYAGALWELYTLAALQNSRRMQRAVVVYEDLLRHPRRTIESLIAALPELSELQPTPAMIKDAISRVRRDLNHAKQGKDKGAPPALSDVYNRIASGDLTISKDSTSYAMSMEMVRLEVGHQAAKRMNLEAREKLARAASELAAEKSLLARHAERLGDIVSLVSEPGEAIPTSPEQMLERLRRAVRTIPGPTFKSYAEDAARELVQTKDERIAWLGQELAALSARQKATLDQLWSSETELVKLRAEKTGLASQREADSREIVRLNVEMKRLADLAASVEQSYARLADEHARTKKEFVQLRADLEQQLSQARGSLERTENALASATSDRQNLQARQTELKAEISRLIEERSESQALARERAAKIAELGAELSERERLLATLSAREQEHGQLILLREGEIRELQGEVTLSREREAQLSATLAIRDQAESALRSAAAQQNALLADLEQQLSQARGSLERTENALASATSDRQNLQARQTELKAEISRLIEERSESQALARERAVSLDELKQKAGAASKLWAEEKDRLRLELMNSRNSADELRRQLEKAKSDLEEDRQNENKTLNRLADEKARIQRTLAAANDQVTELRKRYETSRTAHAAAKEREAEEARQRQELERELTLASTHAADLLKQLDASRSAHAAAKEREAEGARQRQELERELTLASTHATDLLKQLDASRSAHAAAKEREAEGARQRQELERALGLAANELAEIKKQVDALTAALEDSRLHSEQIASNAANEKGALERVIAEARREASELQEQMASASASLDEEKHKSEKALAKLRGDLVELQAQFHSANARLEQDNLLKAEHQVLMDALTSARSRCQQLEMELSTKLSGSQANASLPGADKRLHRQLLVMTDLLQTIDQLLSPRYGRFTIPVRQIRVRLVQVRQVLDNEIALARSR
jgi:hypothetical protein